MGLEDFSRADTEHGGGQLTLGCCLPIRTCCPSVAGPGAVLLAASLLWAWQVFPVLLHHAGHGSLCEATSGLCAQSRLLWCSDGYGARGTAASGSPDLAAGSVVTLGPGDGVGLLSQGPEALRALGFPPTLLLKPS